MLIEEQGRELFGEFARNWNKMCLSLAEMKHLSVPVQDGRQDPGKLPVSVKNTELTGQELYEILLEEYHIQTEMAAPDYVLAMFSAGDGKEGYERLTHALLEIDGRLKGASASVECVTEKISQPECMKLTEAWDRESCLCPIQECEGRWAAEFINLYPPGIPAAVPGEKISKELIRWILDCLAGKMSVQGIKQCDGRIFLHVLR